MPSRLPEYSDPRRFADSGRRFVGRLALRQLSRLREELVDAAGDVEYELGFGRDEQGRALVKGRVRATLPLQCQRCLGTFLHGVDRQVLLAVVEGLDEAEHLPPEYDPLLMEEDSLVCLSDLIEDELLLAVPQVPMHVRAECSPRAERTQEVSEDPHSVQDNPFAALAELKQKLD